MCRLLGQPRLGHSNDLDLRLNNLWHWKSAPDSANDVTPHRRWGMVLIA